MKFLTASLFLSLVAFEAKAVTIENCLDPFLPVGTVVSETRPMLIKVHVSGNEGIEAANEALKAIGLQTDARWSKLEIHPPMGTYHLTVTSPEQLEGLKKILADSYDESLERAVLESFEEGAPKYPWSWGIPSAKEEVSVYLRFNPGAQNEAFMEEVTKAGIKVQDFGANSFQVDMVSPKQAEKLHELLQGHKSIIEDWMTF